jgi:hypothetical protein
LSFPSGNLTAAEILAYLPHWLKSVDVVDRFVTMDVAGFNPMMNMGSIPRCQPRSISARHRTQRSVVDGNLTTWSSAAVETTLTSAFTTSSSHFYVFQHDSFAEFLRVVDDTCLQRIRKGLDQANDLRSSAEPKNRMMHLRRNTPTPSSRASLPLVDTLFIAQARSVPVASVADRNACFRYRKNGFGLFQQRSLEQHEQRERQGRPGQLQRHASEPSCS